MAVREPENVKWPDIYLPRLFSLSPSVSHSGKGWLCSQDAQLPHGGVIYSRMTQMSHIGTWQDPQLETPLPSCPTTGDAVARGTGLCWHHRIWRDLPRRPNPQYAHDPVSVQLCVVDNSGGVCELNTHLHMFEEDMNVCAWVRKSMCFRVFVFYCGITKNQHRSIMKWTLLSCKGFTGALTWYEQNGQWEISWIMTHLDHFKRGNDGCFHLCCSLANYTLATERVMSAIVSNVCHCVRSFTKGYLVCLNT